MATFLKKVWLFFQKREKLYRLFLNKSCIYQRYRKSRYNVIASTACVPSQADFSNFPKDGNLKKMLVGGSFPLAPSALKNP